MNKGVNLAFGGDLCYGIDIFPKLFRIVTPEGVKVFEF